MAPYEPHAGEMDLVAGRYQRAASVLSARTTDTVVLLDQRQEQYHTLNEVGARIWELLVAGATPSQVVDALAAEYDAPPEVLATDVRHTVRVLLEHGLLEPAQARPDPDRVSPVVPIPAENGRSSPHAVRSIRVPTVLWGALMITWVKLLLAIRGYTRTLAWIRRRVEPIAVDALADPAQVRRAEYNFAMAAAFYPARAQCLERSLALYLALRCQGVAVRYCQGAQPYPFKAHSWLEYQGEVINDVAEHALAYARLPEQLP